MSRPADWQQRGAGRDPERSFIVQAPAGSGKTELLTQRLLGLLARVENPEEIIAITFTRKAAAEMSHRLLLRLHEAHGDIDEDGLEPHQRTSLELARAALRNDAERGWNLLQQPSRLRIRTIDSLCSDLARQLPLLSGLGGGLGITENADELYHLAAVRTMAAIEDDSDPLQADVVRILDRYDNRYDLLVELLRHMLANREQWMQHLVGGVDREALESALRFLVESELEQAHGLVPGWLLLELPPLLDYALANDPTDEAELHALFEGCGGRGCARLALAATADSLPHWNTLINRLLTADGTKWRANGDVKAGFPAPSKARGEEKSIREHWKTRFKEVLDRLRGDDALREQFNTLRSLPRPVYEDEAWESLESLIRVLIRVAQEWKLVMAESGSADFSEVAQRAIQALGEGDMPSNLALRLDYRIQHLLVDEFQDTSHSQVRLLEKLTSGWTAGDGRTLFLVGDPMQSIYRFRKAEVSLFIDAFEGRLFEHVQPLPLQLEVNFRSSEPVVDWVNRVFPAVMPRRNDTIDGAVTYSACQPRPGASQEGLVDIRIEADLDDMREAECIVDLVRDRAADERMAILVRSRKHAAATLARLDQLKQDDERFRYRAIDFNPLAETVLIRDLVSLTLALIQPADRLAWLSVLRAPFTGFELADLDALAAGGDLGIVPSALADALAGAPGMVLSEDGRARLQRVGPVLLEAASRYGRDRIRSVVEQAWVRLGGPACVNNASELSDADTYFQLLDQLENDNLPVDRDSLSERLEKLYAEPDARAPETLQVMTVYLAKGLEFDTVILPGLNKQPGSDKGRLLHWFELADENLIVMSLMRNVEEKERQQKNGDLIQFIAGVEKRRQSLENGRLLYVAATRAVRRLYGFGCLAANAKGELKPTSKSLLSELWPSIREEQERLFDSRSDLPGESLNDAVDDAAGESGSGLALPQVYRRLAAGWTIPSAPVAVQRARADYPEPPEHIEFSWAGENARLTGELVHRLLQLIAEQGLDHWKASGGMDSRRAWCRHQLRREGADGDKAEAIIARAGEAVNRCTESQRGRWILQDHEQGACELAITAIMSGQTENLVLDRTFVDGGVRWIIDYKTSSHGGGDLQGFLASEAERYRDQLDRYREAMALNETHPIRTALYFPLLDHFLEL